MKHLLVVGLLEDQDYKKETQIDSVDFLQHLLDLKQKSNQKDSEMQEANPESVISNMHLVVVSLVSPFSLFCRTSYSQHSTM